MKPVPLHRPGRPSSDAAPERLLALLDRYRPVAPVVRWGLTVTTDGRWAMLVSVPAETEVPIPAVETVAQGFPVVYEVEPQEPILPQAN